MLSRFVSSTVDEGPARSAIISRSSERRSNKCIFPIRHALLASRIWRTLTSSLAKIQARSRSPRQARRFLPSEHEKILVRQEAVLVHAPQTGAPRVAQERFDGNAATGRRAHRCFAAVPVDVHNAP